jgi:immune inhibitor A
VQLLSWRFAVVLRWLSWRVAPREEVTLDGEPFTPDNLFGFPSDTPVGEDNQNGITPQETPTPRLIQPVSGDLERAQSMLALLNEVQIPTNDPREMAQRLAGIQNIPETVVPRLIPYKLNDKDKFWVTDNDTNKNFQITAKLVAIGENVYFWIEDGVKYNLREVNDLVKAFDTKILPTNHEFFGSEWTPGIDGDPRLHILYASGLGDNIGGYFSSADSVNPLANEFSNAKEMFLINADTEALSEEYTYSTLAHEFQHMIHWYRDRNEESWMNEGFSELAQLLNGYTTGGTEFLFTTNPDLQLNDWPNDSNATGPHYGSGFMFVNYFLNRFGESATKALVAHPENGLESVDLVLQEQDAKDPATGEPIRADDLFADWALTNYLLNANVLDGRYWYKNYPSSSQAYDTESVYTCTNNLETRDVNQYGTDYIKFGCEGKWTLNFTSEPLVGILAESAHSGENAFWSNKGDESDMRLSREFDFSSVTTPIEMKYWTWYDLETDYDYVYLLYSEDGSQWKIIQTPLSTDADPSGNSYGWGYNGVSDGWVEETVDLSSLAGKKVWLRFEYVTDAAVNGEGLLLDDMSIAAVDYSTDFETDEGGWQAEGFVHMTNLLPQTYRVSLIKKTGENIAIDKFILTGDNKLSVELDFDQYTDFILVVSGTTRYTRQVAQYQFQLSQ